MDGEYMFQMGGPYTMVSWHGNDLANDKRAHNFIIFSNLYILIHRIAQCLYVKNQ
jgi:hypothetical protein